MNDDLLEGGREGRSGARLAKVLAGVMCAGIVIALLLTRAGDVHQRHSPLPAEPSGQRSADPPVAAFPVDFSGLPVAERTGLRAITASSNLIAGSAVALIDLDGATVTAITVRGDDGLLHDVPTSPGIPVLSRLADATLVSWSCDACNPAPSYLLPDGSTVAVPLGKHDRTEPGVDGRVLLIDDSNPQGLAETAVETVREVDAAGRAVGTPFVTRGRSRVIRGVDGGFLITSPDGGYVVNPSTGNTDRTFPGAIYAATATTVVWSTTCNPSRCVLSWTDLDNKATASVSLPTGAVPGGDAEFNSAGTVLAMDTFENGNAQTQRVFLLSPREPASPVPGSTLDANSVITLAWAGGGSWIMMDATPTSKPDRHSLAFARVASHNAVQNAVKVAIEPFPGGVISGW